MLTLSYCDNVKYNPKFALGTLSTCSPVNMQTFLVRLHGTKALLHLDEQSAIVLTSVLWM